MKKILFTYQKTDVPKVGEWYIDTTSKTILQCNISNFETAYPIYSRQDIFEPGKDERYWYIENFSSQIVNYAVYFNNPFDKHNIYLGNCFETRELAKKKLKEIEPKLRELFN